MATLHVYETAGEIWEHALTSLLDSGVATAPRHDATVERLGVTYELRNPRENIIVNNARKLNYRFMVAEWLWIAFGRDDVKTIAAYNSKITEFSDDGISFNGNYGRPIYQQLPYVIHKLATDPMTRQAIIQIYRMPERPTKDIPCTLSMQFLLRNNRLAMLVNMRSSDVWLGLPYDIFNFTRLGEGVAALLRNRLHNQHIRFYNFVLSLASSHLYDRNRKAAEEAAQWSTTTIQSPSLPDWPCDDLEKVLVTTSPSHVPSVSPWKEYGMALCSPSFGDALAWLGEVQ